MKQVLSVSTFAYKKGSRKQLMPQSQVFYVFLILATITVLVFVYVALSTRQIRDVDYQAAYQLRRIFFVVLSVTLLALLALTLPKTPYGAEALERPEQVVHVVGKQFSFALSNTPITNDKEWEEGTYATPVRIPVSSLVEFRVTSFDVNHGFSLYSPSNHLVAQTQAMPGYINRLRLKLDEPGRYTVLCLEMCGMGHHRMRGVFDVK
jgi:cytochrome c oxidase subunit II